jgi:hypothetical protein
VRRLILTTAAIALAGGVAAPALATELPPIVGVGGNGNGGVCVTISYQVPQCVDLGQVGSTGR